MYVVRMPRLGITMQSGTIVNWMKKEGEAVTQGEALFEFESEKSTVEVEAQQSGVLRKILANEGDEVEINVAIAVIGEADEDIDLSGIDIAGEGSDPEAKGDTASPASGTPAPQPQAAPAKAPPVSPRLRRMASELGVDLGALAQALNGAPISEAAIREAAAGGAQGGQAKTVELTATQRSMKGHLARSWAEIPHFTQIVSVNMTNVLRVRQQIEDAGLNDILVKIVGSTAVKHPLINGRLEADAVTTSAQAHVNVAIATDKGLVVPVVKSVDSRSVQTVASDIRALAARAKAGDLTADDLSGGTITFSNLGAFGIETGTPIINAPQSTLVFAGSIIRSVVVGENDGIFVAPVMKLSVCFDHRFIDGVTAAAFTVALKDRLETLSADDLK